MKNPADKSKGPRVRVRKPGRPRRYDDEFDPEFEEREIIDGGSDEKKPPGQTKKPERGDEV